MPNLRPVGCGTYYSPEDANGRPGFTSILQYMANMVNYKYSFIILINVNSK